MSSKITITLILFLATSQILQARIIPITKTTIRNEESEVRISPSIFKFCWMKLNEDGQLKQICQNLTRLPQVPQSYKNFNLRT